MVNRYILLFSLLSVAVSCSKKEDEPLPEQPDVEINTRILAEGLSFPWEILWGPDGDIWMSEKAGRISRVDTSNGSIDLLLNIDEVETRGEGGLLGMVMPADMNADPYLFIVYNYLNGGAYDEKIVRYTYANETLSDPLTIYSDIRGGNIHNGSRLAISSDKKLFVTTGDAGNQSLPQDPASANGKVLRFNFDGSIPSDNPDPSSPVWSNGHRNAQGLVFVGETLFSTEHGPDSDDEINIIEKGGNYGWPDVKGNCDAPEQTFCDENNVVEPIISWTPTIAVCGLDFYNNDAIPQWKNSLLMCTLKASRLVQLPIGNDGTSVTGENNFFTDDFGRLRDLCISPDGKVFMCTSNGSNDKIIEVTGR